MSETNKTEIEVIVETCNALDEVDDNASLIRIFDYLLNRYLEPIKDEISGKHEATQNIIKKYEKELEQDMLEQVESTENE